MLVCAIFGIWPHGAALSREKQDHERENFQRNQQVKVSFL